MTEGEVDAVLSAEKVITERLRWGRHGLSGPREFLDARVLDVESSELLVLRGNRTAGRPNYSFVLLYRGIPIRKLTVHAKHTNPDGQVIRGPHKHKWTEVDGDALAYVPNDINWHSIDTALVDFLAECNIRLAGAYQLGLN